MLGKWTPFARHISAQVSMSAADCWAPGSFTTSRTDIYAIFLTSLTFWAVPPLRKSIKLDLSLDFLASSFVSIRAARVDVDLHGEGDDDGDELSEMVDR